jgi:hypothetical protein
MVTDVSRFSPLVVTWLSAKRVSARAALLMLTRVSSAGECFSARFASSSASARDRISTGANRLREMKGLMPCVPC